MPSIALAAAGAIATLAVGGSASMAVQEEEYSAAGCKAADLKSQDDYHILSVCKQINDTHYKMWSCSDSTPTKKVYSDSDCETEAAGGDVTYTGDKVCEADSGRWIKRTCVGLSGLGSFSKYDSSTCAENSPTSEGVFSPASCRKKAIWNGSAWTAKSTKIVLSSDGASITSSDHWTMDCSGDVQGNATTYKCGACGEHDGEWMVVDFPDCGAQAHISGAIDSAPALLLKCLALMLLKIACM